MTQLNHMNIAVAGPWIDVRTFGAKGDGTTDDTVAIQNASSALIAQGGGQLYFPKGTYRVWNANTSNLGNFTSLNGIRIISEGATLAIDSGYSGTATMFYFSGCSNIEVSGFTVTGPTFDVSPSSESTPEFVRIAGANNAANLKMDNNKLHSVSGLIVAGTFGDDTTNFKNIHIGNLSVTDGVYGLNFQYSGSNVQVDNLVTDTVHRSYYPYGVYNHKVKIKAKDAYAVDCLLVTYQGSALQDIEIWYTRLADTQTSSDNSECVGLFYSDQTPGTFRNIHLHLNIEWNATGQTGAGAVRITKFDNSLAYDQSDRGHILENLTISGYISGQSHYNEPMIMMDSLCNWGPGDFFRNIVLRDLAIDSNGTRHVSFFHSPFVTPLICENVRAPNVPLDLGFSSGQTVSVVTPIYQNCHFSNQQALACVNTTANTTLTPSSPQLVSNNGATSDVYNTLPTSAPGMQFTFINRAAYRFRAIPASGEYIGTATANEWAETDTIPGTSFTLKCVITGRWEVVGFNGNITYQTTNGVILETALNGSPTYGAIYCGSSNINSQGASNFALASNGVDTYLTAPTGVLYITANGNTSIFQSGGSLSVPQNISAGNGLANSFTLGGSTSTNPVSLTALGSDANINVAIFPKGSGTFFAPNFLVTGTSNVQMSIPANTWVDFNGSAIGASPSAALRWDSSHGYIACNQSFAAGTGTSNYLEIIGGTTGNYPQLQAAGSDTDIGLNILAKGNGNFQFITGSASPAFKVDALGNPIFNGAVATVGAGYANQIQLQGNTSGNAVIVSASGTDSNIAITLDPKGAGSINLNPAGGGNVYVNAGAFVVSGGNILASNIYDASGDLARLGIGDVSSNGYLGDASASGPGHKFGNITTLTSGNIAEFYKDVFSTKVAYIDYLGTLVNLGGEIKHFNSQSGSSYVVLTSDRYIGMSQDAIRTVTLPGAAPAGTEYTIIDTSGSTTVTNILTVSPSSGSIKGDVTGVITPLTNNSLTVVSDGTNYWVVAKI